MYRDDEWIPSDSERLTLANIAFIGLIMVITALAFATAGGWLVWG